MRTNDLDRLMSKVIIKNDCWEWIGYRTKNGYGRFSKGHQNAVYAHRFAYELLIDEIPKGLQLDHLCRNRACVNPEHLEPVTARTNSLRGTGMSARNIKKTHCPQGHEYNKDNTYIYPNGNRRCKVCTQTQEVKNYHREYNLRRKLA